MLRHLVIISGALALVSCTDATGPLETPADLQPRALIVDGRNGGAGGFYFLPPLAPLVSYPGTFDPTRSPVVEVCAMTGSVCGSPVARFITGGTGADVLRADTVNKHYIVPLRTSQWPFSIGTTYRIRVLEGSLELGFAEVVVVKKESDARSLPAGEDRCRARSYTADQVPPRAESRRC